MDRRRIAQERMEARRSLLLGLGAGHAGHCRQRDCGYRQCHR
jgi:hypothetical protein